MENVSLVPATSTQITNGNAKLSVWRTIFSMEAKAEREKIVNRQQAKAIFEQLKAERSGEKVKENNTISAKITANLKHFTTVKCPILLLITFNGTGQSLPIEAKNEIDLMAKVAKLGEDWKKLIEYRQTIKGTGVCQNDIISRSAIRLDVYFDGKRKSSFASSAYSYIGQSHMGNLKAIVEGYLLSFTLPSFELFEAK